MSTTSLLSFLKASTSHEADKRKHFEVLGNPSSSNEERATAYLGLMGMADKQDWDWLLSQMERNPGELSSKVMEPFFNGAAKACPNRLKNFITAEDGVVADSVRAIKAFTEFGGAAIFMTHRAVVALEAIGAKEELAAFALFVKAVCESKANNGLIPRKLFETRLKPYLPTDVVEAQEAVFLELVGSHPQPNGGSGKPGGGGQPHRRPGEGLRPPAKDARTPGGSGEVREQPDIPMTPEMAAARDAAAGKGRKRDKPDNPPKVTGDLSAVVVKSATVQ